MDKGFKYWFENVFWFHYKAHFFAAVTAIIIITVSVGSCVNRVDPDFRFVLASDNPVFSYHGEGLTSFFSERGYDSQCTTAYLGNNPNAMTEWQLFIVTMADTGYSMFIAGESLLGTFEEALEGFIPMDELGLPSSVHPETAEITGAPILKELGLDGERIFALIRRAPVSGNGEAKPKDAAFTQNAIDCLRIILDTIQ